MSSSKDLHVLLAGAGLNTFHQWWNVILEGLEFIIRTERTEDTSSMIFHQLINSQSFLHIVFRHVDDKEPCYVGFFIVKKILENYKGAQTGTLIVDYHYQKDKKFDPAFNLKIQEYIDGLAEDANCRCIKMYTKRKADRYLKKLGYIESYTEYIKGVRNENLQ